MPENNNEEVRTESGESNSKETGYGLLALAGQLSRCHFLLPLRSRRV